MIKIEKLPLPETPSEILRVVAREMIAAGEAGFCQYDFAQASDERPLPAIVKLGDGFRSDDHAFDEGVRFCARGRIVYLYGWRADELACAAFEEVERLSLATINNVCGLNEVTRRMLTVAERLEAAPVAEPT